MSHCVLSEILLMSAAICKQRFLHRKKIQHHLQNYKYEDLNQGHFIKPLRASTNFMKTDYPKKPWKRFSRVLQFLATFYVYIF